jgi:DNA mismatch endonuclease (patch repair protein)
MGHTQVASPTSPGRSRNMAAIRRRDTRFELEIRSILHGMGLRFRVDLPIRLAGMRPIRPDVVFTRRRVAVFCDGCFWHGCPEHGQRPHIRNGHYWTPKITGNRQRDGRQTAALESTGWMVLRFWEDEAPELVAQTVAAAAAGIPLPHPVHDRC